MNDKGRDGFMRLVRWAVLGMVVTAAAFAAELRELPLRVHVYSTRERSMSQAGRPVATEGMGKANLYEKGEPRGFDFRFKCAGRLPTSEGYGTYPARWKERGRVLEIFISDAGREGHRCSVEVELKDFAYFRKDGAVGTEPRAVFKGWMGKHGYDPERGKNVPTP